MLTSTPGQITTTTETGLPTGVVVGYQVIKAATNLVAIARTTVGVIERPLGTGAYAITFTAPIEGDLYLFVADWSGGILTPETSRVSEFLVAAEVVRGSSGLGLVADYAKMYLGGETWKGLVSSVNYGESFVAQAIAAVKARTIGSGTTASEELLQPLVLDYVGICVALQLVTAARDYWGSIETSRSVGNDPAEIVTYANRASLINQLRDDLMRRLPAAQAAALPLIVNPVLTPSSSGPDIDELDDLKATDDPRDLAPQQRYGHVQDTYGFAPTGVRL